jgi:glycerate 2-kinase
LQIFQTGHPLPDGGSLKAGRAAADILARTTANDLVLVLISGGGSAMLELPHPGVTLEDLRSVNTLLLHSGAPITSVNTVRRTLSQIKAGGLARMAAPAKVISLIISDVIGDRLSSIASGPTVLRAPKPEEARAVLQQYQIWDRVPDNIRNALPQTKKPSPPTSWPVNIIIGNNRLVIRAAQKKARQMGFPAKILTTRLEGEAKAAGRRLAASLRRAAEPQCLIAGGETTVHIQGNGRGGRNQELALAAALALEGIPDCALMALATDGVDGPTPAAGAIVTGNTIPRARQLHLDPEGAL